MPRPRTRETRYTRYHDNLREMRRESYELDAQLGLSVSGSSWRPDEDELLIERVGTMGVAAVAKLLGRSSSAVRKRSYQLGLGAPTPRRLWTPEEDQLVLDNYPHLLDSRQLAVKLGREKHQVHSRVSLLVKKGVFDPEELRKRKAEVAEKSRREV